MHGADRHVAWLRGPVMPCRVARLLCAVVLLFATSLFAQDASTDPPAHISFVDGTAVLERDGQPDASPMNMPLLAGDRVRTEDGRLEILFTDGSTLHLDANTRVDFQSDELVRLMDGRVRLSIPGPDRDVLYRIDAPSASVTIDAPGEYRVSILRGQATPEVELAVVRGYAELANDDGRTPLRAGQRAYARASAAPSNAYAFNSASWDAFDSWSEARRDQRLGISTQYLPEEVRPYASSFDRHGSWRYETSYGYVWYPTVAVDWRPYHNGRWVTLRPYGWTWVGADPWDWPTHHYGRWGISAGLWFWIPGRSWGPAWVSWAYSPGYVSWCPLGWNNRAVVLNRFGRGYDPWRAWTAVPEHRFGGRDNVRRVMARDFDVRTPREFVTRNTAPEIRGTAVPRSSAPIRIAGTASGRRGNSPVYTNLEAGSSRVGSAPSRTMVGPTREMTSAPSRSSQPGSAVDRSRAVTRTEADRNDGATGASSQPGVRARGSQAIQSQSPGREQNPPPNTQERYGVYDRTPGSSRARRGSAVSRLPERAQDSDNPATSGGAAGMPSPGRVPSQERVRPAPYGDRSYGAQPRDNPAYRPIPAPAERGAGDAPGAQRTPAPSGPVGRPGYGSDNSARAPERRAPEHAPDSGARAVPRAEPRAEHPAAPSNSGGDRHGSDRPSGGSSDGGRSRSGGRGR
jgi:hypothetical protein